jgi:hypothetical protein
VPRPIAEGIPHVMDTLICMTDVFDTIQAEDLMKHADVMASFACHAAMSGEQMPRKIFR